MPSRETLLQALQDNDPNGCWTDDLARDEFGDDFEILSWVEAVCIIREITDAGSYREALIDLGVTHG